MKCEHPTCTVLGLTGGRRRYTCLGCGATWYLDALPIDLPAAAEAVREVK